MTGNTEVLGETSKTKCKQTNGTDYKILDRSRNKFWTDPRGYYGDYPVS